MAPLIGCGGGVIGLGAAVMLARDGHQVPVLEADSTSPPQASAVAPGSAGSARVWPSSGSRTTCSAPSAGLRRGAAARFDAGDRT